MSTQKVSALTELTTADANDVLLISDVSAAESKKIQKSNITQENFTTTLKNKLDALDSSAYATAAQGALADSALQNIVEDTTPQLGGTLDANGQNIDMGVNVITDPKVGQWESTYSTVSAGATNWDTAYGWGNHASAGYLTGITGQSIENLSDVTTMTPTDGQLLTWNNTGSYWEAADAPVSLPDQTSHSGEFLTTDGSTASWTTVPSDYNVTTKGLYEMANTISSNYSITSGNNAMSAGPITVDSGITVTVPSGSTWTIV